MPKYYNTRTGNIVLTQEELNPQQMVDMGYTTESPSPEGTTYTRQFDDDSPTRNVFTPDKKEPSVISTDKAIGRVNEDKSYYDEISSTPPTIVEEAPKEKEREQDTSISGVTGDTYTTEEVMEIWGNDFTGLQRTKDGKWIPDAGAYKRLGVTGVEETSPEDEVSEYDKLIEEQTNAFLTYNVDQDPAYQAQVANIRAQFDKHRAEMRKKNEARANAYAALGYRSGTTQYAGGVQLSIEGEELRQAGERIAEITRQEAAALSAARIAFENNEYAKFSQKVGALQTLRENKQEALTEYNNKLIAAAEKEQKDRQFELDMLKFELDIKKSEENDDIKGYNFAKARGQLPEGTTLLDYIAMKDDLTSDPKTIGSEKVGYWQYDRATGTWTNLIPASPGTLTRDDLSPLARLQARNLSVELFGTRAGMKEENFGLIQDLVAGGMAPDDIRDQIRYSGQSEEFGAFRDIFNFITAGRGFSTDERERSEDALDEYLQRDDIEGAKEFMIDLALGKASNDEYDDYSARANARAGVLALDAKLKEYVAAGGDIGVVSGKYEKIIQRLGQTKDPKLAKINNDIALLIQKYRQELTGAAFTESEAKEYIKMFPGIDKSIELNEALTESLLEKYDRDDEVLMNRLLGSRGYEALFGKNAITREKTLDEFFTQNPRYEGVISNMLRDGINEKDIVKILEIGVPDEYWHPPLPAPTGSIGGFNKVGSDTNQAPSSRYLANYGSITGYGSDYWKHGLDIDLKVGDPVYAPASGRVIAVNHGWNKGFGTQVKIRGNDGKEYWLSHLDKANVKVGDSVRGGQKVALGGKTGKVIPLGGEDGSHLDLTVLDENGNYISPREIEQLLNTYA